MTVPRLTKKGQKVGSAQFLETPTPSPKLLKFSSHSLTYEITHSYKNLQPHTLVPASLAFDMAHTHKPSPWLTLEFFPASKPRTHTWQPTQELT